MPQFDKSQLNNFIGQGITFPLVLVNGRPNLDNGFTLIRASIRTILAWAFGSRFFLSEFGSRLDQLLEEPNDDILKDLLETYVVDAITKWEKRVELQNVTAERPAHEGVGDMFNLTITYRVIATEREDTFIFPFYRQIIY